MASGGRRLVTGSFNGTGADLNMTKVGFRPTKVRVFNRTGLATLEWNADMPDDSGYKAITDGTQSFITTDGITPLATGFAFGADADLNVALELCYFECWD